MVGKVLRDGGAGKEWLRRLDEWHGKCEEANEKKWIDKGERPEPKVPE